ncbi:hypothetical protein L2E82_30612 [Cichorium intybus]|uniref:Uncharacterized protein n=1 Tax=Cichorium intybus TaxID=13427 RepID=A0ACB9D0V4_CICIN|nr:hypothetical protein L2E82_30612 [Cichorium intybus]
MEALGSFLLWSLDSILADFAIQQSGTKGSKKVAQKTPSKSQVGLFVVLAMVLRRKPDALITILPTLNETPKYHGQDKLPLIVWMVAQASQGDLAVDIYGNETNVPLKETRKKVWLVDSKGLIVKSRLDSLQHFKKPWAHDHEPVNDFLDAVKPPSSLLLQAM